MKILCIFLAIGALAAAQPQPSASTLTGTIDFRATTSKGEVVADLTAADITMKVGGRERRIRSLDVISPARASEAPVASAPAALPPPFAVTPAADTGTVRHVMLIIDEGLIPFGSEQPLKDGVARLIEALSPRDRIGLLSLTQGGAQIDYTTDRAAIQDAVNGIVGGKGVGDPSHQRLILNAIRTAIGSTPPGLSSSILFVSGGGSMQRDAPMPFGGRIQPDEIRAVEQAIELAQVNTYVIHVGATLSQGLNNLAGSIGAGTALLSFADATTLARVVAPSSIHYRATFDGDSSDKAGTPMRVELRVTRQNVRVDAPSLARVRATSSAADVSSLLRSPASARDLPLRAAAFASGQGAERLKIVVLFEPLDPSAKITAAMLAVFDAADQVVSQATLRPADFVSYPAVAALTVPSSGAYRVRVAAVDSSGRGGTVDDPFNAELTKAGSVKLSGLVLGIEKNDRFGPRLEFTDEPAAAAYIEMYGVPSNAALTVVFELAETATGPAKASASGKIQKTPGEALIATANLPIATLASGDAIVRAVVTVNGAAGRVVRTLRKTRQ